MAFDPNKITFFARTDARGRDVAFGIKAKDRQRHVYVIGKTGMGKSTLLENMAVQDIQNGEGLAFIDPHGSAAETLLNYVPEHRVNDVLYFAPFDTGFPVSFNIMEDVGPDKRHLVVSGLMSVFKKIWIDAWSARMEYILQNTLMALLEYPDSTLLGVNRMLSDKDYRKKVVDNLKDPGVKSFWVDEFAKYNERYMQEAGDAIKNKIGQFTANPIIRNIVGQPKSSFDIREMMDQKKILIVNLSKGLIGESNANLLGSMLTTRIYLAAMSRADLSPEKMRDMPNFYFYVDEFQSFANATFANILSEARKYHLNLTIAHQYITQMEEEVRDAVFGNVGTIISFRVGPLDAELLETIFSPQFLATDIVNLGFAQVYLTLMIDGIGSPPFSATTLPKIEPPVVSCKDMVIASSRKQFSHLRHDVEIQIHKFHEPVNPPKPLRTEASNPEPKKEQGETRETKDIRVTPRETFERKVPQAPVSERVPARAETSTQAPQANVTSQTAQPATPPAPKPTEPERNLRGGEERKQNFVKREERPPHQQGGARPPQSKGQEPARPHHSREENLNELRSVLKNIVSAEATKEQTGVPDKRHLEKEQKFKESRGELQNLLANALHTEKEETVAVAETPNVAPVVSPVKVVEQPGAPQPTRPVEPAQQPSRNVITAKELERMMRVNLHDKPPL